LLDLTDRVWGAGIPSRLAEGACVPEEYDLFEPFHIRYDGLDAENHQMELLRLGESMTGAAKMLGTVGNFALTGKFVRKTPALSVRVLTAPPERACYEIVAVIVAAVYSALPLSPASMTKLVEQIVKYILAKYGGRPKEADMAIELARVAITEMGSTSRAHADVAIRAIEAVAESQRINARLLVSPIGETCETLTIGHPGRGPMIVDRSMKEAINAEQAVEILDEATYEITISEIDLLRRSCKLSLVKDDDEQRYDGEITDPIIEMPHNAYAVAVAERAVLRIRAKAQIRDGDFHKFYISNTAA
jgi:hypothetical protein